MARSKKYRWGEDPSADVVQVGKLAAKGLGKLGSLVRSRAADRSLPQDLQRLKTIIEGFRPAKRFDREIRYQDELLNSQIRFTSQSVGQLQVMDDHYTQIQAIYNDPSNIALNSASSTFFNSIHDLSNNPESDSARQLVQQNGATLAHAVSTRYSQLTTLQMDLNSKTLACINCHRLEGIGGNVGPDLTRLWETQSIEKIMESMIEPSKEIKEGYQSYQATTKKGLVYTGLKIAQTAEEVVLREASGKDVRIAAKDLDELSVSKQSLMPDNAVAQITYDQFIDLVAFLKDRPAQESLRGMALEGK